MADPTCPVCASLRITPPGDFLLSGAEIAMVRVGAGSTARIERARTCLDCGTVMPALSEEQLAKLRPNLGG